MGMSNTIQQLSVFMENREGRLDEILKILSEAGVNIVALSQMCIRDSLSRLDKRSFFFYLFDPMQYVKKLSIMCNIDKKFEFMKKQVYKFAKEIRQNGGILWKSSWKESSPVWRNCTNAEQQRMEPIPGWPTLRKMDVYKRQQLQLSEAEGRSIPMYHSGKDEFPGEDLSGGYRTWPAI